MLETMKELGFIPESRAIKLYVNDSSVAIGERYDRVTYLRETLPIRLQVSEPVYVESGRFLSLLPYISTAEARDNYLEVKLRNGAIYKLPYLDIEFDRPQLSEEEPTIVLQGVLDFTAVKKTVLKNLVKPEMRCIYVDDKGAVSCNFLQGTTDLNLRSSVQGLKFLLPPDLVDYMDTAEPGMIAIIGSHLFYMSTGDSQHKKWIWAPTAQFDEVAEGEQAWYDSIFAMTQSIDESSLCAMPEGIEDALKRLASFSDTVEFTPDKIISGDNFEPLGVPTANGEKFSIEDVSSVVAPSAGIGIYDGVLYMRKNNVTVLVSQKEEE